MTEYQNDKQQLCFRSFIDGLERRSMTRASAPPYAAHP